MFASLPSLNSLRVFEAAARHQSFTVAAEELAVTQGAVSYQVRRLEGALGIDLFRRKTRQVALTVEGERLFRAVHRMLRDLDDEVRAISPRSDRMVLTVAVSTYVAARWLSPRLGRFFSAHPEITLRLQHSVNDPTFAVEDVDMAIRWGDGNWPGVVAELLLASPMMPVCAPGLTAGATSIRGPEDLRRSDIAARPARHRSLGGVAGQGGRGMSGAGLGIDHYGSECTGPGGHGRAGRGACRLSDR